MNWILVAFVFNLAANGDFDPPKMLYRGFATEEACNFAGEHFREQFVLPESTKSVPSASTRLRSIQRAGRSSGHPRARHLLPGNAPT